MIKINSAYVEDNPYITSRYINEIKTHLRNSEHLQKSIIEANLDYIEYTLKHKVAFINLYKQLIGDISPLAYMHDVEKLVQYSLMEKELASNLHTKYSYHHYPNYRNPEDIINSIIDYECARLTKPDKPLNAYETILKFHPEAFNDMRPFLKRLGLESVNRIPLSKRLATSMNKTSYSNLVESTKQGIDSLIYFIGANNGNIDHALINWINTCTASHQ